MTLTELKYLVAVADERHFGRAAERCFVSQPSLSAAIRNVEDELGVRIFERGKQGVLVTEIAPRSSRKRGARSTKPSESRRSPSEAKAVTACALASFTRSRRISCRSSSSRCAKPRPRCRSTSKRT
jgi:hypothetical protein